MNNFFGLHNVHNGKIISSIPKPIPSLYTAKHSKSAWKKKEKWNYNAQEYASL